jgi:uncharacterized protein (TIGR02145 family)
MSGYTYLEDFQDVKSKISCPISLVPYPRALYLLFLIVAFLGCADIPEELVDEASGKKFDYCVFDGQKMCLTGTFTYKDCSGKASDKCPYGSPKKCEGMYNPSTSFCYNGNAYLKCNGMEYNPEIYICQGDVANPAKCGGSSYNPVEQRCQSNVVESKCGSNWYKISTQFCYKYESGYYGVYDKCNGNEYEPETKFCYGNTIYDKCDGNYARTYDPATQFCYKNGNGDYSVYDKCNGQAYDYDNQRCENDVIKIKCGTTDSYYYYNSETQFCYKNENGDYKIYDKCNGNEYDPETLFCYENNTYERCGNGGSSYNLSTQFCYKYENGDYSVYDKCGGEEYSPETQFCNDYNGYRIYDKCSGQNYRPQNQRCENDIIETQCGTSYWYDTTNTDLRCYKYGSNYNGIVETKCGTGWHNPLTQFCIENSVYNRCGGEEYDPSTQFCYGNVRDKCNGQSYAQASQRCENNVIETKYKCDGNEYEPATQYCSNRTIKTYGSVTQEGKTYKTVVIGTQTWMAENLNYDVVGSKCYNNQESNCDTYGRLYDWSTAMGIDTKYNSQLWGGSDVKHQGICPDDWHIPNNDDWNILMAFVHSDNGLASYTPNSTSNYAGKYLKATSGWNSSYSSIVNLDSYGFSALPGGSGYSDGSFSSVGSLGIWWSSYEDTSVNAYYRGMYYYDESARWGYSSKNSLFSVRCVED